VKKFSSRVLLCCGLAVLANSAHAEGWYVGGSFNPMLTVAGLSSPIGAVIAGINAQVGYQTKEGFGTRFNANILALSFDGYQQLDPKPGESSFYLGAGVTYSPFLATSSLNSSYFFLPFGIKGILGYEFRGKASPLGIFLEYSPVINLGCLSNRRCYEDVGGIVTNFAGLINFQAGLNYRF
jgi:hypothetical protein